MADVPDTSGHEHSKDGASEDMRLDTAEAASKEDTGKRLLVEAFHRMDVEASAS